MTFAELDAILTRFFTAIPAGDLETIKATYHPDAVIWHNNDNQVQGVDANLRTLRWVGRNIANLRYEEIRRIATSDGGVLQKHVLRGTARNGTELNVYAAIVFGFNDEGQITRLEEYLDTGQTAALFS